jgi:NAD(P)-dependent dehydrogenase (short-subunit alcohol dehydrogenase family)
MRLLETALLGLGAYAAYRWLSTPTYDFNGKHVLITGGARGLGLLIARELAGKGAKLTICSRSTDDLDGALAELSPRAPTLAVPCDVTDQRQVDDLIAQARGRFGPIDVLVNNAGIIGVGPVEEMRLEDFDLAMKTHFWAAVYTCLAVVPEMQRRRTGRIVNISSIGGKIAVPHMLPYTASKFAVTGLSHGLRQELAKDGVVVTTVCPGVMRTGSHLHAEFKGRNEEEYRWFAATAGFPGFSVNATSAARAIVSACARGDAELIISIPARIAVMLQTLMPGWFDDLNALVNRFVLPEPGGIGTARAKGYESRGATPSLLTALPDQAARENNETNLAQV